MLDESREFTCVIDSQRTISGCPMKDSGNVVLSVEDPHCIAIVEIGQSDLIEIIEELTKLKVEGDNG